MLYSKFYTSNLTEFKTIPREKKFFYSFHFPVPSFSDENIKRLDTLHNLNLSEMTINAQRFYFRLCNTLDMAGIIPWPDTGHFQKNKESSF